MGVAMSGRSEEPRARTAGEAQQPKRVLEEEIVEACALTAILYTTYEEVERFFGREAGKPCRGSR